LLIVLFALLAASAAWAGEKSVKIGVLTDLTSFASRSAGQGSVDAAKIAVLDFGGTVAGKPIEVLVADMRAVIVSGRSNRGDPHFSNSAESVRCAASSDPTGRT